MDKFTKYIQELQEKFGLQNWVIDVTEDEAQKQNAKTLADARYNRAVITINPEILKHKREWDRIIYHEFIHICLSLYDFYVDNHIQDDDMIAVARESGVSNLVEIYLRNLK